jgi:ATP-dependent protease ClpP protease subunit
MKQDQLQDIIVNGSQKPYMNVAEIKYNRFDVFIDTEITEPEDYRDLIYHLFNATEDDSFVFYINSVGGNLASALSIIEGLKHTSASTTAIVQGECHSAASMIMLYCQEVIVLESAHAMIHTASYGTVGNTGNVKAHTEFATKKIEKLLNETYEGFLSDSELTKIKLGVELWFDAEEIRERLDSRVKFMEAKLAKEQSEQQPKKNTRKKAA